jgi:hypothetical protein
MFMLQKNKDQENVCIGVKGALAGAKPATTKRSALGEIGNDPAACRGIVARKVGGDKPQALPQK